MSCMVALPLDPGLTRPSRAQYIILTKVLGIQQIFCAVGFSMGGQEVCKIIAKFCKNGSKHSLERYTTGRLCILNS
jgi:hypothetical protein